MIHKRNISTIDPDYKLGVIKMIFLSRYQHTVQETYKTASQLVLIPVASISGCVDLHGHCIPRGLSASFYPG